MRSIPLAAGIVVVGVLAALPFRHVKPPTDQSAPVGVATGPLGRQHRSDSIDGVMQWPDRPGFDPSIAWQPQPMRLDAAVPSVEMPPMPDSFPIDTIEVPIPAPIRDRYDAVLEMRQPEPTKTDTLVIPSIDPIKDHFVYKPAPERNHSPTTPIQQASVIRTEPSDARPPSQRQYIREPQ